MKPFSGLIFPHVSEILNHSHTLGLSQHLLEMRTRPRWTLTHAHYILSLFGEAHRPRKSIHRLWA